MRKLDGAYDGSIPSDAVVVSTAAFAADEPQRIVVSNAAFVDALFAEFLTAEEIAPDALRSYFVQYYLAQMDNGGFAQFVYNSNWDPNVVAKVREGLRTMGARMHQAVFLEGVTTVRQLGQEALDEFLSRDFWGDNPVRDRLDAVTEQFVKAGEVEDLAARNAEWLRAHPKLQVLTRDEMEAEVARRVVAVPDLPDRLVAAREQEPRPVKLIRVLCVLAGHELEAIAAGDPTHLHKGQATVAWHFTTDVGAHLMVEADGRAMMFATDDPDQVVCEISDFGSAEQYCQYPPIRLNASGSYATSRSSAIRRASSSARTLSGPSAPRRRRRARFGRVNTLSQLATQPSTTPSDSPSGTSVRIPLTVVATITTVTFESTGIATSRVAITTGRGPAGRSSTS